MELMHPRNARRLATEEEKKRGVISSEVLNWTPVELQRWSRKGSDTGAG